LTAHSIELPLINLHPASPQVAAGQEEGRKEGEGKKKKKRDVYLYFLFSSLLNIIRLPRRGIPRSDAEIFNLRMGRRERKGTGKGLLPDF